MTFFFRNQGKKNIQFTRQKIIGKPNSPTTHPQFQDPLSEGEWIERFCKISKQFDSSKFASIEFRKTIPHVKQAFENPKSNYECRTDIPFVRILHSEYPRLKYRRRKGEVKTVIHWGQRKLLMSEIEFLTTYARSGMTVVYAGAAPGTHLSYLSNLFPYVTFELYDPAPFTVRESAKIKIFTGNDGMFTDETAKKYSGRNDVLFICDVRSADWQQMEDEDTEEQVKQGNISLRFLFQLLNMKFIDSF
jgi:hypothetical protein